MIETEPALGVLDQEAAIALRGGDAPDRRPLTREAPDVVCGDGAVFAQHLGPDVEGSVDATRHQRAFADQKRRRRDRRRAVGEQDRFLGSGSRESPPEQPSVLADRVQVALLLVQQQLARRNGGGELQLLHGFVPLAGKKVLLHRSLLEDQPSVGELRGDGGGRLRGAGGEGAQRGAGGIQARDHGIADLGCDEAIVTAEADREDDRYQHQPSVVRGGQQPRVRGVRPHRVELDPLRARAGARRPWRHRRGAIPAPLRRGRGRRRGCGARRPAGPWGRRRSAQCFARAPPEQR